MKSVTAIFVLSATFGFCGSSSHAQFVASQKWVPDGANMIALFRSSDIFSSEIAKDQRWRQDAQRAFDAGVSKIPPYTERFLIASQMDLEFMQRNWQVSVIEALRTIDVVEISKSVGGNLDMLDGNQSLLLPTDAFLVKVADKTIAAMAPADRQMAVRWLKQSKRSQPRLSDYLSSAVRTADPNTHILVALDFEDFITPDWAKEKLQGSEIIAEAEIEPVSQLISEMKGITLAITVKDKVTGVIKIDFRKNPELLAGTAKNLLMNALEATGLMIDDFQEWHSSVKNNQILLSGSLSPAGMRQIGMLIQQPIPSDVDYESEDNVDSKTRSIQYFRTIEGLVNEIRHKEHRNVKSMAAYAKWFDNYARRIDELSVLGIDQDLVAYGQFVADGLRDITPILAGEFDQAANLTRYGGYYGGYYGRGRGRAKAGGGKAAIEAMNAIDSRTSEMRKTLTQKYGVEF